jgi:hypothetical protein
VICGDVVPVIPLTPLRSGRDSCSDPDAYSWMPLGKDLPDLNA